MAKSPLETAVDNWRVRHAQLQSMGVDKNQYVGLMQKDIANTMAGGTPMTRTDVGVGLAADISGQSVVGEPTPAHHPGVLGGIESVLGAVPGDITGIIKALPKGLASAVVHAPQTLEHTGSFLEHMQDPNWLVAHGYEDPHGNVGAALRNVAKTGFSFVPGVSTAAGLTSAQGRRQLEQHPVGALLDVLPAASQAGELVAGAALGGQAAEAGSALEALQAGSPIKAAVRSTADIADHLPVLKGLGWADRANWTKMANAMGISKEIREGLARPFSLASKRLRDQTITYARQVSKIVGGMNDEELYNAAAAYGKGTATPQQAALVTKLKGLTQQMAEQGVQRGGLVKVPIGNGKTEFYSVDDKVARDYGLYARQTDRYKAALDKYQSYQSTVERHENALFNKSGKVRKFMEGDAEFNARAPGAVGVQAVSDAMTSLREAFVHLDPRKVFNVDVSDLSSQAATRAIRDFTMLSGEKGLFQQFEELMQARDFRGAQRVSSQIARILKHKSLDSFDSTTRIRAHIQDIRKELVGLRGRERAHRYAADRLQAAHAKLGQLQERVRVTQKGLEDRSNAFHKRLVESPPARFHPYITNLVRQGLEKRARQTMHGMALDSALRTIQESPITSELQKVVGPTEFKAIYDSSVQMWMQLADQGLDPLWLHHVDATKYESILYPRPLPDELVTPGIYEKKALNFGPAMHDVAASVTAAQMEVLRSIATEHYVNEFVMPLAVDRGQTIRELQDQFRGSPEAQKFGLNNVVQRQIHQEFAAFDPAQYGVRPRVRMTREGLLLPKHVARTMEQMMGKSGAGLQHLPITGAYDKVMRTFKFSVLTGPRHFVHVAVGGTMFMLGREPRALLQLKNAYELMHPVEGEIPELVSKLHQPIYNVDTDHVFQFAAGQSAGQHFIQAIGDKVKAFAKIEEHISDIQRAATYLSEIQRGVDPEVALQAAYKVFVDQDGMAPIERTVIRNIFPFYGFTRHLFRYLLTYPVDYPIRAAILSRFSEQEMADWKSGLPQKYQQLFFMGKPDKNGNVTAIDFKSINPFRSFGSDFSIAGFFQMLNPLLTIPAQVAGVNTLTGTGQLYPELSYDPQSGSLVAVRPKGAVARGIESIVPEFGVLDHFLGLTSQMKNLKRTNPNAYRQALFSQLNIPFAFGPVNVPLVKETAEMNRLKAAQAAVSEGTKTGDFTRAAEFQRVPYQGHLVPEQELQQYWAQLLAYLKQAGYGGISPKAILPKPSIRRRA